MFRLTHHSNFLEIDGAADADAPPPGRGDLTLRIRVQSEGYSGEATASVSGEAAAGFRQALMAVIGSARGEATLVSMSPGELSLRVYATSSLGHWAVQGSIGRHVYAGRERHWHALSFGFEVDGGQLREAVHAAWMVTSVG